MDYIANSKNRKFKKQILVFLDRINFGTSKLPYSGRFILFLVVILGFSLFFPWIEFEYFNNERVSYSAFSSYVGYVGYGVIFSIVAIPFFLLSHAKKEKIRAIVPFRLSDTQLIVFIISVILTALFHLFAMVSVFHQFATPYFGVGIKLAATSALCILIATFFLSKKTKEDSIELRHIHHQEPLLNDEYATILGKKPKKDAGEDGNMVLPI